MIKKTLPADLTSYDILKTVAVLLMIADHVGYYFFPGEEGWRIAGRFCVPIWFFLIGYAHSRDIGWKLWAGIGVICLANLGLGLDMLPVTILLTIMIVRLVLDPLMILLAGDRGLIWPLTVCLAILALPSGVVIEYGTMGLVLAMAGYLLRHEPGADRTLLYIGLTGICFIIYQGLVFQFSTPGMGFFMLGTTAVMALLYYFRPQTYPSVGRKSAFLIQLCGRHTLVIYVLHLLLFKILYTMSI